VTTRKPRVLVLTLKWRQRKGKEGAKGEEGEEGKEGA